MRLCLAVVSPGEFGGFAVSIGRSALGLKVGRNSLWCRHCGYSVCEYEEEFEAESSRSGIVVVIAGR